MSTAELFQHRSIDLSLGGRYSLASRYDTRGSRREFACRTSRISPYQMHIAVPVLGPVVGTLIGFGLGGLDYRSCRGRYSPQSGITAAEA